MIIFNYAGIIIAVIGFAAAFGIGAVIVTSAEGPLMIIAGPLIATLDLTYRFKSPDGHWNRKKGSGIVSLKESCPLY